MSAGTFGLNAWVAGRNAALSAAERMTPVLAQSQFAHKGVLTPDEFVAAGDMLVLRSPTWQWQAGDPAKARSFLPPEKQFLLTKNVPCQTRASSLAVGAHEEQTIHMSGVGDHGSCDDEGWQLTHTSRAATNFEASDNSRLNKVADLVGDMRLSGACAPGAINMGEGRKRNAEVPRAADRKNEGEAVLEAAVDVADDDPSTLNFDEIENKASGSVLRTRTYDVSITYDKYYKCARVWLYGYSESRQPLTQPEILQDISVDHALKTVTLESHPHIMSGAGLHASIHPCKHAQVMQKLCAELRHAGRDLKVDAYLFLFLKFISSVCPTIEYDYTLSID